MNQFKKNFKKGAVDGVITYLLLSLVVSVIYGLKQLLTSCTLKRKTKSK